MRIRNLGYTFKLAFQGIVRNGFMSLASMLVLVSCLIVLGCTYLLTVNIDYNIKQLTGYNKIVAFVAEDAEDYEVANLLTKIETIPNVQTVTLITKEEALEGYKEEFGDFTYLFDMFNEQNPLKDSFEITYTEGASVDTVSTIIFHLEELESEGIVKVKNRQDIAQKLDDLKDVVSMVLTWLTILLFIISFLVVMNTVRLSVFARRDEIAIMRSVGATRLFVALPFLIEGTILGIISAALSFTAIYFLYGAITAQVLGVGGYEFVHVLPFARFQWLIAIAFVVIAFVTGVIAGSAALRRQGKV